MTRHASFFRNTLRRCSCAALVGFVSLGIFNGALAHHGTAVSYDQGTWITVTGTVTEFRWRNPHSSLFLDIVDDAGNTTNYAIELPSPVLMTRSNGWTRATFKPGDMIEFRVHPSRTGAAVGECLFNCLVKVNGVELPSALPQSAEN